MKSAPNVIEFLTDPQLLKLSLSPAQSSCLRAIDGLGNDMTSEEKEIYRLCTGRKNLPTKPCREASILSGARGGKTGRIACGHGAHKAAFGNHVKHLARGERAVIPLVAQDFSAGKVAKDYFQDYFTNSPLLKGMVDGDVLATEIKLVNRTSIRVFSCTHAAMRAYSIPNAYLDEVSMWRMEGSVDSDIEVLTSCRRGMIQFPDSQIIRTSTPYLKDGVMYADFQNFFGVDDSPLLVWRASTLLMNPSLRTAELETLKRIDPLRYSREFDAEWIDALDSFIPAAWVEGAVRRNRRDNPPIPGMAYVKSIDQSQLRGDKFAIAIGHKEKDAVIIDLVRAWSGNGAEIVNLEAVVQEIVTIARRYGGTADFIGDQQAKDWVSEAFRRAGGSFRKSERDTSTCYLEAEPFFSQGRIEIPDDADLIRELKLLERRPRPGGKVLVDHPRNGHDDLAAAVARCVANMARAGVGFMYSGGQRVATMKDWIDQPDSSQADDGLHPVDRLMGGGRGRVRFDW
jgi:hypothetical protein